MEEITGYALEPPWVDERRFLAHPSKLGADRRTRPGEGQNLISTVVSDSWVARAYFQFLTAFRADSASNG